MTDRLSDVDLAAMKERADKATEGPWFWKEDFAKPCDEGTGLALTNAANFEVVGAYNYHCCTFRVDPIITRNEDAEFIAAARFDVPALVAEVEALRAENETLRQIIEKLDLHANDVLRARMVDAKRSQERFAEVRAERDQARAEAAELRRALVRAVAHEAQLVALLDPDNDEAVEIVANRWSVTGYLMRQKARNVLRGLSEYAEYLRDAAEDTTESFPPTTVN